MASAYSPLWHRWLFKLAPGLFWTCPEGNRHWRWERRVCCCQMPERVWIYGTAYKLRKEASTNG